MISRMPDLWPVLLLASALTAQPVVTWAQETMRLRSASVTANGAAFDLALVVENDNADASLPASYRRWWHCEIRNLRPAGETLHVAVQNAGYSDLILPVWAGSTDGTSFAAYARAPLSAVPTYTGGVHRFTLQTPPGAVAIRLAKFFPYPVARRDAWLATLNGDPRVRAITNLGTTALGRSLPLVEISDPAVPDAGKRRVWVHAGIHPAETTSYLVVEGLVAELLSRQPAMDLLLGRTILDVVPMANPDGVARGNYRTNSGSVNLEEQWAAPYTSTAPEIVALRTRIEGRMGSATAPGLNPIEVLLNLHASHDVAYPFHFQHVANPGFDLQSSRSGVIPAVNALEGAWITRAKARSPFLARGTTQSSTMGAPARPFVEAMLHDRWSIDPLWLRAKVMAITLEGTYGKGPDQNSWCTEADYRALGRGLAWALLDHFSLLPGGVAASSGTPCGGPLLSAGFANAYGRLDLAVQQAPISPFGIFVFGTTAQTLPLPPTLCPLRTDVAIGLPAAIDAAGRAGLQLPLPVLPALAAQVQCVVLDAQAQGLFATSNLLRVVVAR